MALKYGQIRKQEDEVFIDVKYSGVSTTICIDEDILKKAKFLAGKEITSDLKTAIGEICKTKDGPYTFYIIKAKQGKKSVNLFFTEKMCPVLPKITKD